MMPSQGSQDVDVSSIERELTVLWKETEEGESLSPVVRACSLNLIVLGGDDPSATEILDTLSREHPARTFLISEKNANGPEFIESWVDAKCAIPLPGEKQVCSEQIHLTAGSDSVGRIPSIVASLLVSDIPVVLWHRGTDVAPAELFEDLQRLSDFTILDSAGDGDLELSLSFLRSESAIRFGDLAWERGQSWRTLLAHLFDPHEERAFLERLTGITIRYDLSNHGRTGLASAMLFAGWLGHSLDLHGRLHTGADGCVRGDLVMDKKQVSLNMEGEPCKDGNRSPIRSLLLEWGASSLMLSVNEPGNCFLLLRKAPRGDKQEGNIPQRGGSDGEMLSRLLTVLDPDPPYRQSLAVLAGFLRQGP